MSTDIIEIAVPYAAYKKLPEYEYKTKWDSYDAATKTIVLLVREYDVPELNARIETIKSGWEAKRRERADDERRTISIRYSDYKKKVFEGRIKKTVKYSYSYSKRTIDVVAKSDEDMEYILHYHSKKDKERYSKRAEFLDGMIDEYEVVPDVIDITTISDEIPEELKNA